MSYGGGKIRSACVYLLERAAIGCAPLGLPFSCASVAIYFSLAGSGEHPIERCLGIAQQNPKECHRAGNTEPEN